MDGAGVVTERYARKVPGRSKRVVPGLLCGVLAIGLSAAALHPLHLSTSHLAVDEKTAWLRIRMFKDDLEAALGAHAGVDSLLLEPSAEHDSLFLAYFSEAFGLRFNGIEVAGAIESSGEDLESGDGDLRIWWYQVRFDGTEVIRELEVRNEILYEAFRDQRNIVRVLHAPTETRKTLYFAAPDDGWSEVSW